MKVINKGIDMIAWFKLDGQIRPIRFRLSENEERYVIEVNKVIATNIEKIAGKTIHTFRCQSVINGAEKVYEIRFIADDMRWMLFKI